VLPAPLGPTLARKQRQRQGRWRAALPCHDQTFNLAEHRCHPLPRRAPPGAGGSLDRHATYIGAAYLAGAAR